MAGSSQHQILFLGDGYWFGLCRPDLLDLRIVKVFVMQRETPGISRLVFQRLEHCPDVTESAVGPARFEQHYWHCKMHCMTWRVELHELLLSVLLVGCFCFLSLRTTV